LAPVPFSGTIDPEMGTTAILSDTLFGRTRGAVLAVLYGHIGESFYLRQLSRRTGISLGPVQRELRQLVDAGLVTRETLGTHTLYSANQANPVFDEMRSLVAKTVGVHDALLDALIPLKNKISVAFVYGSVAHSRESGHSDIDLMIVGRVRFGEVIESLGEVQKTLNREINPTVYSIREFATKMRGSFLKAVLSAKKLFLIGDENVLGELGQQ
jgi:uncharacterized protein